MEKLIEAIKLCGSPYPCERCAYWAGGTGVDEQTIMLGNKGWQPLNFCPICEAPTTEEGTQIILKNLERLIAIKLEESNHD